MTDDQRVLVNFLLEKYHRGIYGNQVDGQTI